MRQSHKFSSQRKPLSLKESFQQRVQSAATTNSKLGVTTGIGVRRAAPAIQEMERLLVSVLLGT